MNSADVTKRRAPPSASLGELQIVVGQVEQILGPLVVIENDGTDTVLSFDEGRETPATLVVLEDDLGQASPRAGLDEFVTRGAASSPAHPSQSPPTGPPSAPARPPATKFHPKVVRYSTQSPAPNHPVTMSFMGEGGSLTFRTIPT
jgi:hypothetical protein